MGSRAFQAGAEVERRVSLHALILESAEGDAARIVQSLEEGGYEVLAKIVTLQEEFLRAMEKEPFDVILSDSRLTGWTGIEACEALKASGRDIPFLLVTGALGEEAAVECIKRGVSDYVLKEHLGRLPEAVRRSLLEKAAAAKAEQTIAETVAKTRQQLEEIDLFYRTSPVCFGLLDEDLRFLSVNEAMAKNHGFPADEHPGLLLRDVVPEAYEEARPLFEKVFQTGQPILNVEARAKRTYSPYEMRHYIISFFPVQTAPAAKKTACVVMVDITERAQAEQALRTTAERNRELVENSVYGICRVNDRGNFVDANPALLRLLGCESAEQVKKLNLFRDVFRFPEQHIKYFHTCADEGSVKGAEAEWRRIDGGFVSVRMQLRMLRQRDEQVEFEVIAEDVTELRAMERQLLQAQKFEAIGQLAGGIAHDFNNVVGAILGWAEIGYDQSAGNPAVASRFARIREQGERAASLTKELLAFARRQVLQPRVIDLNAIASGLVTFLDRVIGKDIELKIQTEPLEPVKADPTQIEQVIMNLCLNARDAMPNGGRLIIETEMAEVDEAYCQYYPQAVPGRYAVIAVSDTGIGMDAETKERIFEPFFTTKESGRGSGMGLATVYGIVKQHGGFTQVYSEPGQGTLFRVYLPVTTNGVVEQSAAAAIANASQELRGSELILLAEDHESIREMARQVLQRMGYRVLCAATGEEAIRLAGEEKPALAILDVVMPQMGGPAAAALLTQQYPDLLVVYTSGYSHDWAGLNRGARGTFLQKPYSPTALVKLVRNVLDQCSRDTHHHQG